jgi:hypothetical protein
MRVVLGDIDSTGHDIGRADPINAAAFGHRFAIVDQAGARRHSIAGIDPA